jgi:hypothetical protein
MWKSEREVMIVAAEMTAILRSAQLQRDTELLSFFKSELVVSRNRSSVMLACAVQNCETGSKDPIETLLMIPVN